MEIKPVPYTGLKQAVLTVQAFAEEKTGGIQMRFLRQGLEDGLQMAGDDTSKFLEDFLERFQIK